MVVTLTVQAGVFAATSASGVTVSGDGTTVLSLTGTVADINAFIASGAITLTVPTGSDTNLIVSIDDQSGAANAVTTAVVELATGSPPTDFTLSGASVVENAAWGTTVGTLSATDPEGGALTYTLLSHTDIFTIDISSGTPTLATKVVLDYETASSYAVEIAVTDADGNTVIETFEVSVTNVNDAPVISYTASTDLVETDGGGTVIGTFAIEDIEGDTLTITLTDDANGRFELVTEDGVTSLVSVGPFDYEMATSHSVTLYVSDGTNYTTQTIVVPVVDAVDVGSAPTDVALSNTTISEAGRVGTILGILSATDADGDAITYMIAEVGDYEYFDCGHSRMAPSPWCWRGPSTTRAATRSTGCTSSSSTSPNSASNTTRRPSRSSPPTSPSSCRRCRPARTTPASPRTSRPAPRSATSAPSTARSRP